MPPKGWKTLTMSEEVFDWFRDYWNKRKTYYRLKYGIDSFSGFVTKVLYDSIQERKLPILREPVKPELEKKRPAHKEPQ